MRWRFRPGRLAWALCLSAGLLAPAAHGQAPATPQTPQTPVEPKKEPKKEEPAAAPTTPDTSTDTSSSDQSADSGDTGSSFDSAVGYIDSAIPQNVLRERVDWAFHNNRPSRAEFLYARGGPLGPGFRDFAGNIDYQEITTYLEGKIGELASAFLEVPVRFVSPQFDGSEGGLGDINGGFKYAFYKDEDVVATLQVRAWAPTGDVHDGLSNGHASIEPALLLYTRLNDWLVMESEFRYWAPIGGTNFAGDVIRYGVGFSYGERDRCGAWVTPVVEFVGWTVLNGKEQVGPSAASIISAAGDTIVNAKLGVRAGYADVGDVYVGYGRALTGDVWYKDLLRVEFRLHF